MKTKDFFESLKQESFLRLEEKSGLSRQALYGALKSQNMKLSNLSSVAESLGLEVQVVPAESEENLLRSLKNFGAPVTYEEGGTLSLEATVAMGVKKAREDGYYESMVPYVLAMNASALNVTKLFGLVLLNNEVNALGYFCELALAFRPSANLKKLLSLLKDMKADGKELLVKNEKMNFPELFSKNHLALKWNLLTRGTEQDHLERYVKWQQLRKNNSRSYLQKSTKS